jgi:hypothetical protein
MCVNELDGSLIILNLFITSTVVYKILMMILYDNIAYTSKNETIKTVNVYITHEKEHDSVTSSRLCL